VRACSGVTPGLTALDASGTVLPFTIHYGGSQSVTNQQPEAMMIGPGGSAFVTFGKYRCDVGDKALAQEVKVICPTLQRLPGLTCPP